VSLEVPLISGFTRSSPCKIMRIIIIVSISALRHTHDRFENQLKAYAASGAALQQGGSTMIQMLICRLTSCPGHDKATVVLEDVDRRLELAGLIPIHEAYRLARVLRLARCTYVPVLELIDGLLAHGNARVLHAVLDGDEAGVSATLYVGENDGEAVFPCHPVDALALAERTRAPIYVTDEVLHHARPLGQPHGRENGHLDSVHYPELTRLEHFTFSVARQELNVSQYSALDRIPVALWE
jgi:bifunctional DNase/RNase